MNDISGALNFLVWLGATALVVAVGWRIGQLAGWW